MRDETAPREGDEPGPEVYEPPRIESVLTAEDLAREILYAGTVSSSS